MPSDYAELEIGLYTHSDSYEVELRFSNPQSEAETAPVRGPSALQLDELRALQLDPQHYGQTLAAQLYSDPEVRRLYSQVKAAIETAGLELRLRLVVGPGARELHSVRWELLADPDSGMPVATSERTLFSRFVTSRDWRTVKLRPRSGLRALLAVSAPSDLARYQLAEVDRDQEVERARAGLGDVEVVVAGQAEALTLPLLVNRLRELEIDILYLVCHGALLKKGPYLWLQDDAGESAVTPGAALVQQLGELTGLPRLILLASCESAMTEPDSNGARAPDLSPLAPRLAEIGVPAIIAMQGKISMPSVETAIPVFFRELLKDGQINRAMAVARGAIRDRPDAWMPALYLRLKRGRIWYEPGFGEAEDFKRWDAIVSSVRSGRFTPILGPGISEAVYGSWRENAARLAEVHHYPLAAHQRDDMPKVAQYLRVKQSAAFARDEIKQQMRREIIRRHGSHLAPELHTASLAKLLRAVRDLPRQRDQDPYTSLAELPAPIYITCAPDNVLSTALEAAGRDPDVYYCNWRRSKREVEPYTREPSAQTPLVYHILGYFKNEDSLVLSEDDYFDYLIGTTVNRPLIPEVVRDATTSSSLIFLGFQLTDWSFRVLFRIIMNQEGGAQRNDFAHVAVQIDPEEQMIDANQARDYLRDYFEKSANINIYWGSSEDFLKDLRARLAAAGPEATPDVQDEDDDW